MAKVRKDKHGLYVLAGGYCFRPDFPFGYRHIYPNKTEFSVGDTVKARHKSGTPLASINVQKDEITYYTEVWFSHGAYMGHRDGRKRSSEELYRPDYETWCL